MNTPQQLELARKAAEAIAEDLKEMLLTPSHYMHSKIPTSCIDDLAAIILSHCFPQGQGATHEGMIEIMKGAIRSIPAMVKPREFDSPEMTLLDEVLTQFDAALLREVHHCFPQQQPVVCSECGHPIATYRGRCMWEDEDGSPCGHECESPPASVHLSCGDPRPDDGSECAYGFCPRARDGCTEHCVEHHQAICLAVPVSPGEEYVCGDCGNTLEDTHDPSCTYRGVVKREQTVIREKTLNSPGEGERQNADLDAWLREVRQTKG